MKPFNAMHNRWHLSLAANIIHSGGIIAYPTEAVYGLGCDPLNPEAVQHLLELKNRPTHKGFILIAADFVQLRPYVGHLSQTILQRIKKSWPGHTTWLLPANPDVPFWIRGDHSTVAVRVTEHPLAAALCRAADCALISTSANITGHTAARSALEVRRKFRGSIDYFLHGKTGHQKTSSEIRDSASDNIIRP